MNRVKYKVYLKQHGGTLPQTFFGDRAEISEGLLFIFDTNNTFAVLNLDNVLWYTGETADKDTDA